MKKLLLSALLMLCVSAFAQKQYTLQSPDGKITVTVSENEICETNSERSEYCLYYSIKHEETAVLDKSAIFMQIDNGKTLGISSKPSIISAKTQSVNQTVKAPFYKRAEIQSRDRDGAGRDGRVRRAPGPCAGDAGEPVLLRCVHRAQGAHPRADPLLQELIRFKERFEASQGKEIW